MFIRPLSDVHNEFSTFNLPPTSVDSETVLLLAGDIALADRTESTLVPFLDSLTERFRDILYIPGNHEYYHSSLMRADDKLKAACARYSNVHYMQEKFMVIDDVMFIGATLWTDFDGGNPIASMTAHQSMNDFNYIRTGPATLPYERKMRPLDVMGINAQHRKFIEDSLKTAHRSGNKAVVFTHHSPTMQSCTGAYPAGPLDYAYYNTRMDDLIMEYGPALWVHGHSHHPIDFMMGETRMCSNPRGYSRDPHGHEGLGFNDQLVIQV